MLDLTPWASGDPARPHSAETARSVAYAATGGGDGVVLPDGCKVLPLATPGGSVRVMPGAVAAINRAANGAGQSFIGRVISEHVVAIPATGSTGGRTDLIAAIFRDPSSGNGGVEGGPGFEVVAIPDASGTATRLQQVPGYEFTSGYALARVVLPASTATVTAAMITDLRWLVQEKTLPVWAQATSPGSTDTSAPRDALTHAGSSTFIRWPSAASFPVKVPPWATHAVIRATISSLVVKVGATNGRMRASAFGQQTPHVSYDQNWDGGPYRVDKSFGGELPIAPQYRDTVQSINFDGNRSSGAGYLDADAFTTSLLDITFLQRIER